MFERAKILGEFLAWYSTRLWGQWRRWRARKFGRKISLVVFPDEWRIKTDDRP